MGDPGARGTPGTHSTVEPKRALVLARVIWFVMVAMVGSLFTFLVVTGQTAQQLLAREADGQSVAVPPILFYVGIGLTGLALTMGPFLRGQIFKAGWVGDVVKPSAYFAGNIIAWALCEGAAMYGLVVFFLAGSFWPYGLPPAVAYLFLLLLWPNGRAMFPPRDHYATGER